MAADNKLANRLHLEDHPHLATLKKPVFLVCPTLSICLLYTSDAADERSSVDLGGRRIIKKKKTHNKHRDNIIKYVHMKYITNTLSHCIKRRLNIPEKQ